jgi:ribosomal protein L39E
MKFVYSEGWSSVKHAIVMEGKPSLVAMKKYLTKKHWANFEVPLLIMIDTGKTSIFPDEQYWEAWLTAEGTQEVNFTVLWNGISKPLLIDVALYLKLNSNYFFSLVCYILMGVVMITTYMETPGKPFMISIGIYLISLWAIGLIFCGWSNLSSLKDKEESKLLPENEEPKEVKMKVAKATREVVRERKPSAEN